MQTTDLVGVVYTAGAGGERVGVAAVGGSSRAGGGGGGSGGGGR